MTSDSKSPVAKFPKHSDVPPELIAAVGPVQPHYVLNGQVLTWTGATHDVFSAVHLDGPNGPTPFRVGARPHMGESDAMAALDSAVRAWDNGRGEWPQMTVAERIKHVTDFAARMKAARDQVARLLMWEIAKPLADCYKEFDRTIDYIRDTVDALKDLDRANSRFQIENGFIAQIRRSPLGVTLCMGPFNYPLNETFTTLIPALIMGNPVVFKTPRFGCLLFEPLLEAFAKSFPPGVISTLYGDGSQVIGPMMASGKIDILAFIGSAKVGNILKHQHPKSNRLRCVLGLDAKNPAVILPDADLDLAARECLAGAFSFNGQRCTAIKVIFVHRSIATAFCDRFAQNVAALKVGPPWMEGVQITPMAEEKKPLWLKGLIDEVTARGAKVINAGGGQVDRTYLTPAAVYPVPLDATLCNVEQFGPVVPIVPFDDAADVLRWIVDSPYGQQAAIFGQNPETLAPLIDTLVNQVCRVNLNCQCQRGPDVFPFAGRKDSAEGTLSVSDALRAFSIRTLLATKEQDSSESIISKILTERRSKFLSTDFIF